MRLVPSATAHSLHSSQNGWGWGAGGGIDKNSPNQMTKSHLNEIFVWIVMSGEFVEFIDDFIINFSMIEPEHNSTMESKYVHWKARASQCFIIICRSSVLCWWFVFIFRWVCLCFLFPPRRWSLANLWNEDRSMVRMVIECFATFS